MKKNRIYKGNSLISFPESFTIIDIETTGLSPDYDKIIEVSALKVVNHVVTDSFSSLIKPTSDIDGIYIDSFIVDLTGITNEMLANAPDPLPTLHDYFSFLGNDILLGHNINFDINFLYDYSEKLFSRPLENNFIDTMRISRRLHPEKPHHRLSDLCARYSIDNSAAHRSLADCNTTFECYNALCNDIIVCFGTLEGFVQFCAKASKDNHYIRVSDITPSTTNIDISNPLYGKVFVFTGTLEKMPRKEAMQLVVDHGGTNGSSVTKSTNYLVLGNNDYCSLIKDGKSNKQKKAENLKLQGYDIDIISENVFYDMLEDI
ncbi:MAG: exonuclease [Lachnospiraceae bacterium]|nr:exonuclease [Lachnospiraceae bacterium]